MVSGRLVGQLRRIGCGMGFLVAFRLAVSQVSQGQGQGSELRVQEYAGGGGGSGSVGKSTVVAYAHMSDRQFGFSPVGASRIVRNPKLQDLWYRTGLSTCTPASVVLPNLFQP